MTLTPFQKRALLLFASAVLSVIAQMYPAYHALIAQFASVLVGITIPGPDTNHTVTVQASIPLDVKEEQ